MAAYFFDFKNFWLPLAFVGLSSIVNAQETELGKTVRFCGNKFPPKIAIEVNPVELQNFNTINFSGQNLNLTCGIHDFLSFNGSYSYYSKSSLAPIYRENLWQTQGVTLPNHAFPTEKFKRNERFEFGVTLYQIIENRRDSIIKIHPENASNISGNTINKIGFDAGFQYYNFLINDFSQRFIGIQKSQFDGHFDLPESTSNQTIFSAKNLKLGIKYTLTAKRSFNVNNKVRERYYQLDVFTHYISALQLHLSNVFAPVEEIETVNGVQNLYVEFNLDENTSIEKRGFDSGLAVKIGSRHLFANGEMLLAMLPNIDRNVQYFIKLGIGYRL